ncbi:hypothetical protein [Moorena sp. SIO3H5]|uniref:hypothetical protein n=1 Tax=Moorena sp. SIO3H5 TaxID=2607834 RepID=UPI0013BB8A3F|nr:hypothetical protein [Moorena sp. SIO3H5]NEO68604.1 hypothetical protein [Moorena sp. SIO3H5]
MQCGLGGFLHERLHQDRESASKKTLPHKCNQGYIIDYKSQTKNDIAIIIKTLSALLLL